ncbi:MAG: RNA polymerase sigma-70 factor [Tannerella sp.]|jgi:RNA polymerase sigma-70 factor (ECF subfamily)|nr:RNA polymerase sigma-70 factor [Tannerella sp.]
MNELKLDNFNDFYNRNFQRSYLFAKSYVHDDMEAEDIAAEALIKIWEMSREKTIEKPLQLLFTILKNKSLDSLRHEEIRQRAMEELNEMGMRELSMRISTLEACDPEMAYSEEIRRIYEKTVNAMPEQTRRIYLMSRSENLTRIEIANVIGMTKKGVEYHIAKAINALQISLKDYIPLPCIIFFFC